MAAADRLCDGRLVLLHEGGYSTLAVPYCGLAVLEALTGHATSVAFDEATDGDPAQRPLHQHERDAVTAAAANLRE
jgi:acetoin utilization deacetylase AcuC-like enzyme